jgi:hypothetical protein
MIPNPGFSFGHTTSRQGAGFAKGMRYKAARGFDPELMV